MPFSLFEVTCNLFVEKDLHFNLVITPVYPEVASGKFVKVEAGWDLEGIRQQLGLEHPGEAECPNFLAEVAESNNVSPLLQKISSSQPLGRCEFIAILDQQPSSG